MNTIIATVIGGLTSIVVLVGGVNAAQDEHKPVSKEKLYSYSDQ